MINFNEKRGWRRGEEEGMGAEARRIGEEGEERNKENEEWIVIAAGSFILAIRRRFQLNLRRVYRVSVLPWHGSIVDDLTLMVSTD